MQTLSITFTGSPIPFGKIDFPPAAIKDIINNIKNSVALGKSYMNELKKEFMNPLKATLDQAKAQINKFTDNNFEGLRKNLPDFFNNADSSVVAARDKLLNLIGNATTAVNQKFLGVPIVDLATMGDTMYDAYNTFCNHTNEISGVSPDDKTMVLQLMYGNVAISGATVNTNSSNVVTINASSSVYPILNIGDTIIVNSQESDIIGKRYTAVSGGTVYTSGSNTIYTSSVATLNLAVSVSPGMYVNVNSSIRRVNTVNSFGDFFTVYTPFMYANAGATLYKESAVVVNTTITVTANNLSISKRTPFMATSQCLGNTIVGVGTSFTNYLQANDKVYFDDKEYYVTAVTNTIIYLDDVTRNQTNTIVQKVVAEFPSLQLIEGNKPDDILSHFATLDQMTNSMGGAASLLQDYTVKYGSTLYGGGISVPAQKPSDCVQSLQNSYLVDKVSRTIQGILDDFQGDCIRQLTSSELVSLINSKIDEVQFVRDSLIDSVQRDLAVINAIKGVLNGLMKLFIISCSKKKAKNGDGTSDEYLNLILIPNPQRQGCAAVGSDLIDILDNADDQHNDPNLPDFEYTPYVDDKSMEALENLSAGDDLTPDYAFSSEGSAGDDADVSVDNLPTEPPVVDDPCAKPC